MKKVIDVMNRSLLVNLFLSFIKIVFGYVGHSRALITDGIHSISDLATDIVVVGGSHFAAKPADEKHPYGHGKAEYLLSLLLGVVVIMLGFNLILRTKNASIVKPDLIVIYVSLFTIAIKLLLSQFVLLKSKKLHSNILKSSGMESRADVFTSLIVLTSVILMQFNNPYLKYADLIASFLIGLFIIKVGIDIIKDSSSYIIGEAVIDESYKKALFKIINKDKDIYEIEDLIVLKFGHYKKLSATFSMRSDLNLTEAHDKIDFIEKEFKNYDSSITYITIHMCPHKEEKDEK